MFGLPSLYLKLAGGLVVVLALAWHAFSDWRTSSALDQTRQELAQLKASYTTLEAQYKDATTQAEQLRKAADAATQARLKVQLDLVATQKRLREAKVPTECPAAVDWLLEERK